jgi:hypothetical protein
VLSDEELTPDHSEVNQEEIKNEDKINNHKSETLEEMAIRNGTLQGNGY